MTGLFEALPGGKVLDLTHHHAIGPHIGMQGCSQTSPHLALFLYALY